MISYEKHTLANGLTLLLHEDHATPLVTVNTLYCVGARNEDPQRTGFAHLFEHLMFGGTPHVPDYDAVVNSIGGESNASTSNDSTNYYVTAPAKFLRQMLTIEADRMAGLDFSERVLAVQRQVVEEEYNQRFTNQPYGDKWMLMRPLCYKVHPYRWCTIGADIRHVREATVDDEREFFAKHYYPANAIVAVAGDINVRETLAMAEELYGVIANSRRRDQCILPIEPEQTSERRLTVERDVPYDMLMMAFPMCHRLHPDFVVYDLVSDVLSNGDSSRMYNKLVKDDSIFDEVNAYIMGSLDAGLMVVQGKPADGVTLEEAETAVWRVLDDLTANGVGEYELGKVVNKFESTFAFSQYSVPDRAANLCLFESLGHLHWVNDEPLEYRKVTPVDILRVARECFQHHKANVLYYKSKR
ncbi:MAG: insulinase family protein [Bacteroidales bacterium]|nr:insulinase family protein [Bacteroidales bacterium]